MLNKRQAEIGELKIRLKEAERLTAKAILTLVNKKEKEYIKVICKNIRVEKKTLCNFGKVGLFTVEDFVTSFYLEIKEELKKRYLKNETK